MSSDMFSLTDSTAIITGGSRGIGEAIAIAFGRAGATVIPVARSKNQLEDTVSKIESIDGTGAYFQVDVTEQSAVETLFNDVQAEFGTIDILVNNAGINPYFGSSENLDIATMEDILAVNLTGAFHCSREFGQHIFNVDETGVILNVASVGGLRGMPYQTAYSASKHGLIGMTKSLAVEWAPDIRVNALAPGYVDTQLTKPIQENESIYSTIIDQIPVDRFADPDEIAPAAVYLCSDAGRYITGEVHVVDGGIAAN
ncbi:MAG: SDR family NAD(P)-dependent oxidoreductase [Halobacteriaceae archaeon]